MTSQPALVRRLGLADAVFLGLGSMIGAGVFAAFTPAAQAAGNGLLIGLVIAAAVALCNATSSAQLAAVYPTSGGTYAYGRAQLGPWWGFFAGWSFVIGKTASCAAMALTFAAYAAPAGWERPVAVGAVAALAAVNYRGVSRTAMLTRILVVIVLVSLAIVTAAGVNGAGRNRAAESAGKAVSDAGQSGAEATFSLLDPAGLFAGGWYGILQSAGLLFFAFAGYARIATMGEEVRDPRRTIPRAIGLALAIVVVVYGVLAVVVLATLGPSTVASASEPLTDTVRAAGWAWATPILVVGASAASLGALLALIAGIGRTALAMAREGDLPKWLAAVHPRFRTPHHAEVALAVVICILVLSVDLRGAIGFSSFGVLLYYFVTNIAAFTQRVDVRRYPRALQVIGALACLALVATLPPLAIAAGAGVLLVGGAYRLAAMHASSRRRSS